MYTLLHIARIITFVTLILGATTHNVSKKCLEMCLKSVDTLHKDSTIPQNKQSTFSLKSLLLDELFIVTSVTFIAACFASYCIWHWYTDSRQWTLVMRCTNSVLHTWIPRINGVLCNSWLNPIRNFINKRRRPPANDDNRGADTARNNNPREEEIELRAV